MHSLVDLQNFREITDGDPEIERELFFEFTRVFETGLEELHNCIDCNEERWRAEAHALKGVALNLGAQKLGALCSEAQLAFGANAEPKREYIARIRSEFDLVKAYLDTIHG